MSLVHLNNKIMHKEYANIGELHYKVMEEVGELLQAYGKMGRFGPMSKHPNDPDGLTNAEQVIMEAEDVITRVRELKAHAYELIEESKDTEDQHQLESDDELELCDDECDGVMRLFEGIAELQSRAKVHVVDEPTKNRPY